MWWAVLGSKLVSDLTWWRGKLHRGYFNGCLAAQRLLCVWHGIGKMFFNLLAWWLSLGLHHAGLNPPSPTPPFFSLCAGVMVLHGWQESIRWFVFVCVCVSVVFSSTSWCNVQGCGVNKLYRMGSLRPLVMWLIHLGKARLVFLHNSGTEYWY